MQKLYFRAKGFTQEDSQKWKKHTRPFLLWIAISAIAIYSVGTLTPTSLIDGVPVRSKNLLVIFDGSGSMNDAEIRLNKQLKQLTDSGIVVDKHKSIGFGVSTNGTDTNLLNKLKEGLNKNPKVDAVYVFSDFTYKTPQYDGSDDAGYQKLRQLLRNRGLKMYLVTVRDKPSEKLIEIARQSGGDLI